MISDLMNESIRELLKTCQKIAEDNEKDLTAINIMAIRKGESWELKTAITVKDKKNEDLQKGLK